MIRVCRWAAFSACAAGFFALNAGGLGAEQTSDVQQQLRQLQEQNERLQQQVQEQQKLIDDLSRKVSGVKAATEGRDDSVRSAQTTPSEETAPPSKAPNSFGLGKIHFGVEGGLALFHTESKGQFPNSEFRVDEAKLFVEAPIWKDVYFFSELNITTREEENENLRVGELYLDFENVSRLWKRDGQLNLRIGRLDIPFGEEYLTRDAIDNPLISHSLSDFWGVDEGVELYGAIGNVQYVLAVQNGGHPSLRDFNADKSVAGRLSYEPARWLHVSGSAMRTGALDAEEDFLSELWFGNGWIRSLGSPGTTTTFQAEVFQGDVQVRLPRGHLNAAGGYLKYDDNDSTADNRRNVYYYYVEGQQHLTKKLYAAARWSQIFADKGFPIVGHGDFTDSFFYELTEDLWRLSLGVGYRWSENLLFKTEYTFEEGTKLGGEKRTHQNFFGAEVAFKF